MRADKPGGVRSWDLPAGRAEGDLLQSGWEAALTPEHQGGEGLGQAAHPAVLEQALLDHEEAGAGGDARSRAGPGASLAGLGKAWWRNDTQGHSRLCPYFLCRLSFYHGVRE